MTKRPEVLRGTTRAVKTGCGSLYISINVDDNGMPFEVFATLGKAGNCGSAQTEAIGRLISGWLRDGGDILDIIKKIKGITCQLCSIDNGIYSCADAIAIALQKFTEDE